MKRRPIHIRQVVERDGEVHVTGLPYRKGDEVDVTLVVGSRTGDVPSGLTAQELLNSPLVGMWKDRVDIQDSAVYARQLREKAQRRTS